MKYFLFHFSAIIVGILSFSAIVLCDSVKSLRVDGNDKIIATTRNGSSVAVPVINQGEYTAVIVDGINVGSSVFQKAFYTQIGDLVYVNVNLNIDAVSAGPTTEWTISLPVARTDGNFNATTQAIGSGSNGLGNAVRVISTNGAQTITCRTEVDNDTDNGYTLSFAYSLTNI